MFWGLFPKMFPGLHLLVFISWILIFKPAHNLFVRLPVCRDSNHRKFFFQICFICILWKRYDLPWRILAFVLLKYVCYLEHCIYMYLKNNISKICNRWIKFLFFLILIYCCNDMFELTWFLNIKVNLRISKGLFILCCLILPKK